jgi:Replication-relaxation
VNRLERALQTDLALTERQVRHHYGLEIPDCLERGLSVLALELAPTTSSTQKRPVRIVTLEPAERFDFEWRHLVGVAEMRHRLGANPEDWHGLNHAAQTAPDAVWQRGLETWAIEFDAGSYSRAVVAQKVLRFRAAYDHQIWATASEARARTLTPLLETDPFVVAPF